MPAHPASAPVVTRPAWSWDLAPALLVCLSAPAFFVLRVPWVGWLLLAAGLAAAFLMRRTDAGADAGAERSKPAGRRASASVPPACCATSRSSRSEC